MTDVTTPPAASPPDGPSEPPAPPAPAPPPAPDAPSEPTAPSAGGARRRAAPGSGIPGAGALPVWLAWPVAVLVALLGAFSVAGVGLAMAGAFRPVPVALATAGGTGLGTLALVRGGVVRRATGRGVGTWLPAVAAVAVVVASTGWNLAHHGEHVMVDRDPGVYVVTARWLAEEGDLRVAGPEGPFADRGLRTGGAGFVSGTEDDPRLYAQFAALFPVAIAVGGWVAGDTGILAANAVLGGLALLALYAAATTLVRPAWALAAVAAVAANVVFVHFTRDAFSEPITLALVFGGLWVYALARRRPSLAGGAVAGVLLGASCLARVDAFVTLVPVAAACAVEAMAAAAGPAGQRWRRRAFAASVAVPAAAVAALAAVELDRFSPSYGTALGDNYGLALRAAAAVAAAGAVLAAAAPAALALRRRARPVGEAARALRWALAVVAALALGAWLWVSYGVRPSGVDVPASMPPLAERDPYVVLTMRWLGWYMGPPVLAVACAAWALLVLATAASRRYRGAVAFVAVLSATTLLYLYRPRINPDQIWAMRRFLVVTMPGLYLAVAWLAGELWRRVNGWWSVAPRLAAVAGVVAMVAVSAGTVVAVPGTRAHAGALGAVHELCRRVGPDGAVLIGGTDLMSLALPQTVRTFCGVPTSVAGASTDEGDLAALAADWAAEGRRLFLLTSSEEPHEPVPPGDGVEVASVRLEDLEHTVLHRPHRIEVDRRMVKDEDGTLELYLFPVNAERSTR